MKYFRIFSNVTVASLIISSLALPPANAKSTFYLDLKKGCYAGNSPATSLLEWSGPNYKTLFRTSCNKKYHYQVYFISKLSLNLAGESAQKQSGERCSSALSRLVDLNKVDPRLGIGWFFPDVGAEERKYGKKLICFVRMASSSDEYQSLVQTRPLI